MVDIAEGTGPADRLQTLLLAMTGRVDDDAVNTTRELLGTGRLDAAAEFLTGCLLAGRIPVSSTEQYHLRRVLDDTRSPHSLADRLHVVDAVPAEEHRFAEPEEDGGDLVAALAPVTSRLAGVHGLWSVTRTTPAGASYRAVPRRVLLAEVGSDGSASAVGLQLIEALRRAGVDCSVDVFTSGTDLPGYHRDALAAAQRVSLGGEPPAARAEPAPAAPEVSAPAPEVPAQEAAPPPEPEPAPEPEPEEEPAAARPATAQAESKGEDGSMRVPPAVDAKLTDRERNLLRKLHEELAHREQDRSAPRRQSSRPTQDAWTSTMPGTSTGSFPPISAPVGNQGYSGQQH
ncbi:hypothetical protein [Saccharopolyspora rosea]|uniref:Uncharacterized protein n=1 Tax=Saccharopolyspora rosea TaxID=524884 RepID=A0ABW3FRD6_9PSEU|nr:hypothetical protein [Saccharopolyspora rosea]